jgi:hypothetical protein
MSSARHLEVNMHDVGNSSTTSAEQQEHLMRLAVWRELTVRRVRGLSTTTNLSPHPFQCILVVCLNLETKEPYIKSRYPLNVSESSYLVEAYQQKGFST